LVGKAIKKKKADQLICHYSFINYFLSLKIRLLQINFAKYDILEHYTSHAAVTPSCQRTFSLKPLPACFHHLTFWITKVLETILFGLQGY